MVGFIVLLALALPASPSCTQAQYTAGICTTLTGTVQDDDVGLPGTGTSGGGGGGGATASTPPREPDPPCPSYTYDTQSCRQLGDDAETRPVTLADIAAFRPAPGIQRMQPD